MVEVLDADVAEVEALADVAARTFPLACPPSLPTEDIAAFIAANLSRESFTAYLADPDRRILVARDSGGPILGYAMVVRGVLDDADVQRAVPDRPAVELSKMYALPEVHGSGVAAALMERSLQLAGELDARCVWLGVNQENLRAQRFYAKHGFAVTGTKTFHVGSRVEHDYVMVRALDVTNPS